LCTKSPVARSLDLCSNPGKELRRTERGYATIFRIVKEKNRRAQAPITNSGFFFCLAGPRKDPIFVLSMKRLDSQHDLKWRSWRFPGFSLARSCIRFQPKFMLKSPEKICVPSSINLFIPLFNVPTPWPPGAAAGGSSGSGSRLTPERIPIA
jgi:hypothetical protein